MYVSIIGRHTTSYMQALFEIINTSALIHRLCWESTGQTPTIVKCHQRCVTFKPQTFADDSDPAVYERGDMGFGDLLSHTSITDYSFALTFVEFLYSIIERRMNERWHCGKGMERIGVRMGTRVVTRLCLDSGRCRKQWGRKLG